MVKTRWALFPTVLILGLLSNCASVNIDENCADHTAPKWWSNYRVDGLKRDVLTGAGTERRGRKEDAELAAIASANRELSGWLERRVYAVATWYATKQERSNASVTPDRVSRHVDKLVQEYVAASRESQVENFSRCDGQFESYVLVEVPAEEVPAKVAQRVIEELSGTFAYLSADVVREFEQKLEDELMRLITGTDRGQEKPPRVVLEPLEATYVALRNASVRAAPDAGSEVVGTLPEDGEIFVSARVSGMDWLAVDRGGKRFGYVRANLLQERAKPDESKQALRRTPLAASKLETSMPTSPATRSRPNRHGTVGGDANAGRSVFATNCMVCHGMTGRADGPLSQVLDPKPRDFSVGVFKFDPDQDGVPGSNADLTNIITRGAMAFGGSALMAPWPSLSDSDVENVIAYIRTLEQ